MPNFFLHEDTCRPSCPEHFYPDLGQCVSCHKNCLECNGPQEDDCEACADTSKVLYNGQCLDVCPEGTYKDERTDKCEGKDFRVVGPSKGCWEACPHKARSRASGESSHSSQDAFTLSA